MIPLKQGVAVDVKVGEELILADGKIKIRVERKEGQSARLRVVADRSISITFPKKAMLVS